MYLDTTILLLLPGLLLGLWAQAKVKSAYEKYSKVYTQRGMPASAAVEELLRQQGVTDVSITSVHGTLTDHFDPGTDTLRLSEGVYASSSIAAVGIAAHEAGHALQKKENYPFLSLRTTLVPMVNIGSNLAWPIFLLGILFSWEPLMTAGIVCFGLVVLFSLITLPVEFDASNRAKAWLSSSGLLYNEEIDGVSEILGAAAMTYVSAAVQAISNVMYYASILGSRSGRNRR